MKTAFCSFLALVVGIAIGASWSGIVKRIEGRDSIQWQFVEAAANGDVPKLERLYKKGAKVKEGPMIRGYPQAGYSALLRSTMNLQIESAEWLIAHGADPNQLEGDATPGEIARFKLERAQKMVELLPKKPAEQTDAANSRAFGTSGTSDAGASAPPEASGNS